MLNKILLIIYSGFFLFFFSCKENTVEPEEFGSINGTILDASTNQPVQNASVTTSPASNAIITDASGNFSIINVLAGTYTINISKTEYQKSSTSISVNPNETVVAVILLEKKTSVNSAPLVPADPNPADASIDQLTSVTFAWKAEDPDDDSLTFDLYLYENSTLNPFLIKENLQDTFFVFDSLNFNTTYFWQVIAKDTSGNFTNGKVWSFQTGNMPDFPLVFASKRSGNYEIYATDSLAEKVTRLTKTGGRNWHPLISPNGEKIAFNSDASNEPQIYLMDRNGKNIQKVTSIPVISNYNNGTGFCWSPDGSYLLYANYDKLYRIETDGTNLTLIATAPVERQFKDCAWSPANNKIAVLTSGTNPFDNEIYLMNPNGTEFELFISNIGGMISSPNFSIDGNKLMFTHDQSGNEVQTGRQLDSDIILMRIDRSDSVNISQNKISGTNDLNPRFTSNGANIIFENQNNDQSNEKEIWIMNSDGTNRRKIIENAEMPDWKN